MKGLLFSILLVILSCATGISAIIPDGPAETIYWRQFRAVHVAGNQVLAVGSKGVVTFDWNEQHTQLMETSHTRMAMSPQSSKLFGNELWVSDTGNRIQIFSVDPILGASFRSTAVMPYAFADFARYGDDIIISRQFDGLWRYRLTDGAEPQFVDTCYRGILMTTLITEGDNLYAFDQYNGVMRYDLRGHTFGSFQEYMYSEYEGTSCSKLLDKFFLTGIQGSIIEGSFGKSGSGVEKVTRTVGIQKRVTASADRFVVQNERGVGWIDRNNANIRGQWAVEHGLLGGDVYDAAGGDLWFLYPQLNGGITRYSLRYGADPYELVDRPGPITSLNFAHGLLVTGGRHSPIDVIELDSLGHSSLKFTVTESHPAVGPLVTIGDTILAIYSEAERLAIVEVNYAAASSVAIASIHIDTAGVSDLVYVEHIRGDRNAAIIVYPIGGLLPARLEIYELQDSAGFAPPITWRVAGQIEAFEVFDSLAVFATSKNYLLVYEIDSNLALGSLVRNISLTAPVTAMIYDAPWLRAISGRQISVFDFTEATSATLVGSRSFPRAIADIERFDKYLFAIGPEGLQILDLSDTLPELVAHGYVSGGFFAVDSNHLVVSDGHAIDIFQLALFTPGIPPDDTESTPPPPFAIPKTFAISQNYPNPFNGTTYMEYDVPRASEVSIELYNVLGQRVRTLVSGIKEPGTYRAMWDGLSDAGADVASGVYFYRFTAGENRIIRKMLYLK